MKTIANRRFKPLHFFIKNKKISSFLSLFLTAAFLNLIVSCSYYNVRDVTTSPETIAKQIQDFNMTKNYAVIHSGGNSYHLNNLVLNEDSKIISGVIQTLSPIHDLSNRDKRVHKYNKGKQQPLNEVHFTLGTNIEAAIGSQVSIPFSDITSISVNDRNTGRSIANVLLGTVGVIAVIVIIVALTKSSCPFIYVKNGDEFVFTGELYPGIITANQERDDYLPLSSLKAVNGEYSIKITNELKEIQHTDMVQLIVADHPENVEVLLDKNGIPYTFSSIFSPNKVLIDDLNNDINPALHKDNSSYQFNSDMKNSSSLRHIELDFDKPLETDKGKLYVTVKNSMWLDYVFGKFNEQFGTYYHQFQKDQQSVSNEKSSKWINDQNIPLSVYLKTLKGWELVDKINTVGPMAFRDIVIPLDMSNLTGDKVQIKLETGFMFWEVDYVGIDYTENLPIELQYLEPYQALDQNNNDVTELLAKADQNYFIQPQVGDEVVVTFRSGDSPENIKRSTFLKNRGYYNYIRDYKGQPNFAKLKLFKEAGAFTDFSKYEYEAIMDYGSQFELALN